MIRTGRHEYMVDGDCASYRFTSADMMMAEGIINNDINKMQKYLFDIEKNIPMPEAYFPQNKSSKCRYCNYQEICFEDTFNEFEECAVGFSMNVKKTSEICVQ